MGWFDNDPKAKTDAPGERPAAAPAAAPAPPAPARGAGSTVGERVHINGAIVSDEDLTIVGQVEGTIRARQTLTVAKEAEVSAVIHGRSVVLDGSVNGDVHGAERVVLGATASLVGNISTPSLQIHDGAYFKGSVEMRQAKPEKPAAVKGARAEQAGSVATAAPSRPSKTVDRAADKPPAAVSSSTKRETADENAVSASSGRTA